MKLRSLWFPSVVLTFAFSALLALSAQISTQKSDDQVRLAVDLVLLDAQVLRQKTGRIVGDLKKEDFVLSEDGVKQEITHFGQDTLPLSVVLLIDRGGCLDPFSERVRSATIEALRRLKPQDEIALMAFADSTDLVQGFVRDPRRIVAALDRLPPHEEEAGHCFNYALYEAASYMRRAGNPDGRRVIVVITGLTSSFDCSGLSAAETRQMILESGSVVCGLIPTSPLQRVESGVMRAASGIGGLFRAKTSSLKTLAEETGGEVLSDKADVFDLTFRTLMDHLRTRYSFGFVSSNPKRDGTYRKLKLELASVAQKSHESEGKLVVKTRKGYVASKMAGDSLTKINTINREHDPKK